MKKNVTTRMEAPKWEISFWSSYDFSHQRHEKIILEGIDLPYIMAEYFQTTYPEYIISPDDFELIKDLSDYRWYKVKKLWTKELSISVSEYLEKKS